MPAKDVLADDNFGQGFLVQDSKGVRIYASNANSNGADGIDLKRTTGSFITDSTADFNEGSGILLKRSNSNVIDDTDGFDNFPGGGIVGVGLWLNASSFNSVDSGSFGSNSKSGIYIGCNPGGVVSGTSCGSLGLPPSDGNSIVDATATFNSVDGIGIDAGNGLNSIVDNSAFSNAAFKSLHDGNLGCGSNIWAVNDFAPGTITPPAGGPPNGCINRSSAGSPGA